MWGRWQQSHWQVGGFASWAQEGAGQTLGRLLIHQQLELGRACTCVPDLTDICSNNRLVRKYSYRRPLATQLDNRGGPFDRLAPEA